MNKIETYSCHYDFGEDRIHLIGNAQKRNERMDFWLTRRMVIVLLGHGMTLLEKTDPLTPSVPLNEQQHFHSLQHKSAVASTELQSQKIETLNSTPILMNKVDIKTHRNHFEWIIYNETDQKIAFSTLKRNEMHAIFNMIIHFSKQAHWNLEPLVKKWNEKSATPDKVH